MSDRQLFDRTAAIPRGRYESRIVLDRTVLPPGAGAERMSNPTPLARFNRGAFDVESGAGALRSAQAMGMKTAPVAMSMASWRKAHAAGMVAGGPAVANFARRAEVSRFGGPAVVVIDVDLTDMWRLGKSFEAMAITIRQGHSVIAAAINDGLRGLKTGVRRKLQAWTGIRTYAETARGMTTKPATPGLLVGSLTITDRHRRIGPNFGARWSRANPGGTHAAWNRAQMAPGTFMRPNGVLFKREGRGRLPIAPLWGPNMAREVERHEAEVERDVIAVARARVLATAVRLMSSAIAKGTR